MLLKNTFIATALLLFSSIVHAQIGLGAKTLSGNIGYEFQRTNTKSYDGGYKLRDLNFTPVYGQFVGKSTLISASLAATIEHLTEYYGTAERNLSYFRQFGIGLGVRQYFNPEGKVKVYGQADLGFVLNGRYYGNYDRVFLAGSLSIGASYFLNKSVALNPQIGYAFTRDLTRGYFSDGQRSLLFALQLENFIHKEDDEEKSSEYIYDGKQLIEGNLLFNVTDRVGTNFKLKAFFGQFVTKGLLIGANIDYNYFNQQYISSLTDVGFLARYYFPLTRRLYVYPEARLSGNFNSSYYGSNKQAIGYSGSVGLTYFLNKNIAFETNLFKFNKIETDNQMTYGLNIGMRYFLN